MTRASQLVDRFRAMTREDGGYDRALARLTLMIDVREVTDDDVVQAFCIEAASLDGLYQDDEAALGRELERRKLGDAAEAFASALRREVFPRSPVRVHIEALRALKAGAPCVCEVYHRCDAPHTSPLMDVLSDRTDSAEWRVVKELRCTLCGTTWRFTRQDVDRGHPRFTWERDPQ